jgi:integrase
LAFLFRRHADVLNREGFGALAHVPYLLKSDMSYADVANRFLRERALLDWHPNNRCVAPTGRVRAPSANTIFAIARDLENFLTYCEVNGIGWEDMNYQRLLDTYQADQGSGLWSERGAPLAPSTINRRVGSACELLAWAGDRGLRQPFQLLVGKTLVRNRSGTATPMRAKEISSRIGRVREPIGRLRIPTISEIDDWRNEVAVKHGKTRALACRSILETGMRLEEVALLRADQVPDPADVPDGYPARMEICFGTKGGRQVGDDSKRGKARTLRFSVAFLHELDDYRRLRRAKSVALFRRANSEAKLPLTLFLGEENGRPLTPKMIYDSWTRCRRAPFAGWSPHAGRHVFACLLLLRLIHEECERIGQSAMELPRTALIGQASDLVQLYIRPILGHVSEGTTQRYLEWVADHFLVAEHRAAWARYLEGGDG